MSNDASGKSIVLRRIYRLAFGYGGIPLAIGLILVVFAIIILINISFSGANEWLGSIESPNERGLAYIAVAIVIHAILGKSNVDVKVDGKRP